MAFRLFDSGAGTSGVLGNPPWAQMNLEAVTMNRNGSGSIIASGINSATDTVAYRNDQTFGADQWARVTINAALDPNNNYAAVVVRASGTSGANAKAYAFFTDGGSGATHTGIGLYFNSTSTSTLKDVTTTFAQGDEMMMRIVGSVIFVYKNGVQIDSYDTASDTNKITSGGAPGISVSNYDTNTMLLKNWEGGDNSIIYLTRTTAKTADSGTLAGTGTHTHTRTITAGRAYIMEVAMTTQTSGVAIGTVTDTGGNTWIKQGSTASRASQVAGNTIKGEVWTCLATSSATSISIPWSGGGGNFGSISSCVEEWMGVLSIGGNTNTSGTGNPASLASPTTQDTNNIITWFLVESASNTGTGFTAANNIGIRRINESTWSCVNDADHMGEAVDEFYASSGSSGTLSHNLNTVGDAYVANAVELRTSAGSLAAVTGTITSSATEVDIVTGGKTIIITLTGDTWILP